MMVSATGAKIADFPFVRPDQVPTHRQCKGRAGDRRDQWFDQSPFVVGQIARISRGLNSRASFASIAPAANDVCETLSWFVNRFLRAHEAAQSTRHRRETCDWQHPTRLTPHIKTRNKNSRRNFMILKKIALGMLAGVALGATAKAADIDHVLLISVDGLHALDVARFVDAHPNSALAELSRHGVTYSNARTPANSDSFPGLLALVTGGSPISHGLFYDVSYDRTIFDPTNVTCKGPAGNMMVFDESIDQYNSSHVSQNVIDPARLPRGRNASGQCVAMYPHNIIRTNTIFEVVKSKGGRTAWADKHPAYDLVNGPSGKGVDDLYAPELTNFQGFDNTVDIDCTVANDQLKVA